jgi:curved DNA-binding protein CbpA
MTPRPDPYRVLGLVPGSSAGEIRSAYRRLAKLHHPDTAGDRSLPRFLAIQAAYEALVDGEGHLRTRGWPARGGSGPSRTPNSNAKGASRDGWRARQGGPSARDASKGASGGAGTKARPGQHASAGSGDGGAGATPGGAAGSPPGHGRGQRGGRAKSGERRTARPGSTTYDEAAQPLDPSWDGAGWYGASSGSYWTLNPREYADPRKHGPEYQERARRAARLEALRRAKAARAAAGAGEPPAARSDPGEADETRDAASDVEAGSSATGPEA